MKKIIEEAQLRGLAIDNHVAEYLLNPAAVLMFGISGGKDSDTMVLETLDFLNAITFPGEVALIHSDLGLIEHADSLGQCEKLAKKTGLPLTVVRPVRPMIERWFHRWEGIRQRFIELERVKLVMPFSGAGKARFCTSDEKVTPITAELKKNFPGKFIINAVGIRREESKERAKKPIWQVNDRLKSIKQGTTGIDWFPILGLSLEAVWLSHKKHNFKAHESYDRFGMQRISCSFCVLASKSDLRNSLKDKRNHPAFREIVKLELVSGFSFRQNDWLADYGLHLLNQSEINQLEYAKELSAQRQYLESKVDKDMFFVKDGFPAFQPSMQQAENLADFRRKLSLLYDLGSKYLTGEAVWQRYADLLKIKAEKEAKKK